MLLQVEYSGDYETFSMARFGQKFVTEVANPRSILHWYRQRKSVSQSESLTPLLLEQTGKHGHLHSLKLPTSHLFLLRKKRWQSRARHSPARRDLIRWRNRGTEHAGTSPTAPSESEAQPSIGEEPHRCPHTVCGEGRDRRYFRVREHAHT